MNATVRDSAIGYPVTVAAGTVGGWNAAKAVAAHTDPSRLLPGLAFFATPLVVGAGTGAAAGAMLPGMFGKDSSPQHSALLGAAVGAGVGTLTLANIFRVLMQTR